MTILSAGDYSAIRAAIDVSLDDTILPDSVIAMPIYLGAADLAVKARDPDWASRTGDALTHLTNAAIYLTAALLVAAVPQISGETVPGQSAYTRQLVKPSEQAATLRARADEELAAVLMPTSVTPSRPTMFAVACGRRGR